MPDALARYSRLQEELVWIRTIHLGHESQEEDVILDRMDEVWQNLTVEERRGFSATPSRSLTRAEPPSISDLIDIDIGKTPGPVRQHMAA